MEVRISRSTGVGTFGFYGLDNVLYACLILFLVAHVVIRGDLALLRPQWRHGCE
jgi:hypothetical protein